MGRKSKVNDPSKDITDVKIDDLVNESKNIDAEKVNAILASQEKVVVEENKTEETKVVEVKEDTLATDDPKTEETIIVEGATENIDDVIAECTGNMEESEIKPKEDDDVNTSVKETNNIEPWYVARAKRGHDYYNW